MIVDTTTNTVTIDSQTFDAASGSAWVDGARYTWTPREFKPDDKSQCNDTVTNIYTGPVTLFEMQNKTMLTGNGSLINKNNIYYTDGDLTQYLYCSVTASSNLFHLSSAGNTTTGQYFGVSFTGGQLGVCGRNAKKTNLDDVVAIELRPGDEPLPNLQQLDNSTGLSTYEQLTSMFG